MWAWLKRLIDPDAPAPALTRQQFERRVLRQLARGRDRAGALLLVKVDGLVDPARLHAGSTREPAVRHVHDLVAALAPGCLVATAAPDALLVFVHDLTRGIDLAEVIRIAVQQAVDPACIDDIEFDSAWSCTQPPGPPLLTVTVSACKVAPRHDLGDAIQQAEDTMARARQAGGNRVLWNAVV
ncbi:hypothetical protein [Ideonella sp.]|uniref:hypothetical protein n=1 Tax=Ideonella sp. TaxID=1929293 RepID=UPI0035B3D807